MLVYTTNIRSRHNPYYASLSQVSDRVPGPSSRQSALSRQIDSETNNITVPYRNDQIQAVSRSHRHDISWW